MEIGWRDIVIIILLIIVIIFLIDTFVLNLIPGKGEVGPDLGLLPRDVFQR